jgi:Zn-finger nucleic acid-binding protein
MDQEQRNALLEAIIMNEQFNGLEHDNKELTRPGLFFWTCKDDLDGLRCQGVYLSREELREIQSMLKHYQKNIRKDLQKVMNGDEELYEKMKNHGRIKRKQATDKDLEELKEWLQDGDRAHDRIKISNMPFYSSRYLGKILRRANINERTVEQLHKLLSWNNRRFNRSQIRNILENL